MFDISIDEDKAALETVRVRLVEPPVVDLPRLQGNCMVGTDVSDNVFNVSPCRNKQISR